MLVSRKDGRRPDNRSDKCQPTTISRFAFPPLLRVVSFVFPLIVMASAKFSQIYQRSSYYHYEPASVCGPMIDWSSLLLTTTAQPPFEWPTSSPSRDSHLHLSFSFPIPKQAVGRPPLPARPGKQLPEWFQLEERKKKEYRQNTGKTAATNYSNHGNVNGRKPNSKWGVEMCMCGKLDKSI